MKCQRQIIFLIRSAIFLILVCIGPELWAQPGDPGGDPDVPITGIEYLIGGGALIGARALLRKMKRKGD